MNEPKRRGRPPKARALNQLAAIGDERASASATPLEHSIKPVAELPNPSDLELHSVIQIKVEPHRGVTCQIGHIDGDAVYCYQMMGHGQFNIIKTKTGDFVIISPARKGMVAMKYEHQEKPQTPSWHEKETRPIG